MKIVKVLYRSTMEFTAATDVLTSTNLKTVQLLYPSSKGLKIL